MFILVECCDRNMELLGIHDKKQKLLKTWNHTPFGRDTDFGIDEDSAWLNRSSCEYDWRIWEIPQKVSVDEIRQDSTLV